MKKHLCLLAALASGAASAQAPMQTTLYGNFDEYIGYIHSSSGASITGLNDGAILRSRLGVRGSEELGDGYQMKFTLEQGFAADSGTMADSSRIFDRQAWVGVVAPYGEFRIGRQNTEIFMAGGAIDYTDRTTFGSLFNTFGIPSRYDNDLYYKSPRVQGTQLTLHYALPENTNKTDNGPVLQAMLDWQGEKWRAGYVGLSAEPDRKTATVPDRVVYHNVYLNYQYSKGKLFLVLGRSNNTTSSANGYNTAAILNNVSNPNNYFTGTDINAGRYYNMVQVSADYRISQQLRVGALYGVLHDTSGGGASARGANAGAYYDMSKRTTLYSFVSMLHNDSKAGFRFSGSAGPSANLAGADVNGKKLTGLQTGVLHRF
ncbi:porin [Duganella sp. FT80W]|uniref:Porin n=1 Tax=Duganella guangzhouensis TaxID=2666084 RepID=A0A6I2L3N2_9BURK|nr:porin [Duganella guangzhouensis]MRW91454.1 porin [Duganella guangzhouensis]